MVVELKSKDETVYLWDNSKENLVELDSNQIVFLKLKVRMLPDEKILNRQSGNGIPMGIKMEMLGNDVLAGIKEKLKSLISNKTPILLASHVVDRLLDEEDNRGWEDEEQIENAVRNINRVNSVRLNVDFKNPSNTDELKYLYDYLGIHINSENDERLVIAKIEDDKIRVITLL